MVRLYLSGASLLLPQAEIPHLDGVALEGLLQQFDQCNDPVVALRLARVLSRTPDDRVANALMRKLVNGFAGQQLTSDQKHAVAGIAGSLGWLAGRFDSVYVFLKEHGTKPTFWRSHRKWSVPNVADYSIDKLLAGRSWLSLGASGRPEANAYLLEFLSGRRSLEDSNLAAAVAEAAFHFHLSKAESRGAPNTGGVEDYMDRLHAWINQTEEGQRWWTWYRAQVGVDQPPGSSPGSEGAELKK